MQGGARCYGRWGSLCLEISRNYNEGQCFTIEIKPEHILCRRTLRRCILSHVQMISILRAKTNPLFRNCGLNFSVQYLPTYILVRTNIIWKYIRKNATATSIVILHNLRTYVSTYDVIKNIRSISKQYYRTVRYGNIYCEYVRTVRYHVFSEITFLSLFFTSPKPNCVEIIWNLPYSTYRYIKMLDGKMKQLPYR